MYQRKYGAATVVTFPLITAGGTDLVTSAAHAAGDTQLLPDEGAFGNSNNAFVHEGNGVYSLALDAAELQAARLVLTIIDQTVPKVWEDQVIVIETYGNASAQHAFDLDDAQPDVNVAAIDTDAIDAAAIAAAAAQKIADELLARAIANVEPSAGLRTLYGAVASLVNRVKINAAGDLEIYKTDDATILATLAATTNTDQQPIAELDPP